MNLKEIRSELQKLSELAAGWPSLQRIAPLERDLALEKLRMLYDTLRFGAGPAVLPPAAKPSRPVSAPSAAAEAAPEPRHVIRVEAVEYEDPDIEMVDLSEVLSLDDEEFVEPVAAAPQPADSEEYSRPEPDRRTAPVEPARAEETSAAPTDAPETAGEDEEEYGPEIIEFVPDSDPFAGPVADPLPRKEPAAAPAPAQTSVPKPAPKPVPAPAPEPAPPPRPLVIPTSRPAPPKEPVAAPAPEPILRNEPAAVPASAPAEPARVKEIKTEEAPLASVNPPAEETPTLFGPDDDAAMRHRHKQRVIMSLYDPAPVEAPKPAAERLSKEPAAAGIPNVPEPRTAEPAEPESPVDPESEIVLLDALTEEPVAAAAQAADSETHVLGEVINQDVHTLAETIAAPHASVRLAAPIADLRQAIGINDKFLMIRDLFGGDSSLFDSTVAALNAQESLDDCMIYIAEHFAWNPESESAKLVMELLERKFA